MKQVDLDRLFAKANDCAEDLADDIHPDNTPGRIKRKSRDAFEDFAQWVFEFIDELEPEVEDTSSVAVEVIRHARDGSELYETLYFETLDKATQFIKRFNVIESPRSNPLFDRQWFLEARLKPVEELPVGTVGL